jgi:hypothetical protein
MSGPTDKHDYDLDAILGEKQGGDDAAPRRGLFLGGALLLCVVAAAGFHLLWGKKQPIVHAELSAELGVEERLSSLINADGDWIGTVREPGVGQGDCVELAKAIGLSGSETLTLMDADGMTLAECEG